MYDREHGLRVRVDWSSLGALNEMKLEGIRIAFIKCAIPDISYTPILKWFTRNPKLMDYESGFSIIEGRKPRTTRRLGRTYNDMETVIEKAFANMDDDMKDMKDQENIAKVDVNNLINEAVNFGELEGDTIESKIKELHKQYAEEIREYKAKILDLKNQVATFMMGEASNSSSAQIAPTDSNL